VFLAIFTSAAISESGVFAQSSPPAAEARAVAAGVLVDVASFVPDVAAPFIDYADAWPTRAYREGAAVNGVVVPWNVPVHRLRPVQTRMALPFDPSDDDMEDHAALDPTSRAALELEGIRSVRFFAAADESPAPADESKSKSRGKARNPSKGMMGGPSLKAGPDASLVFRFVSGTEHPRSAPPATGSSPAEPGVSLRIQRSFFAYYDPVSPPSAAIEESPTAPRGRPSGAADPAPTAVVLIMPGLYGTPEPIIDAMILKFRQRGWGVLRMLAQPSRFLELVTFDLRHDSMDADARGVAEVFNDRAAECAYAVQGAWDYLESQRPEIKPLPKAALGISGGAMTLPTVVARDADRYAACVLIGGGADFLLIAQRSAYKLDAASVRLVVPAAEDGVPEFDWRVFDRAYLAHAPLDSFHTAKALHGKQVLMIHGAQDLAVPAALGDVLWERLGRPERWSYEQGHEGLIGTELPREMPRLLDWLAAGLRTP
jgi:hypothetical protein